MVNAGRPRRTPGLTALAETHVSAPTVITRVPSRRCPAARITAPVTSGPPRLPSCMSTQAGAYARRDTPLSISNHRNSVRVSPSRRATIAPPTNTATEPARTARSRAAGTPPASPAHPRGASRRTRARGDPSLPWEHSQTRDRAAPRASLPARRVADRRGPLDTRVLRPDRDGVRALERLRRCPRSAGRGTALARPRHVHQRLPRDVADRPRRGGLRPRENGPDDVHRPRRDGPRAVRRRRAAVRAHWSRSNSDTSWQWSTT